MLWYILKLLVLLPLIAGLAWAVLRPRQEAPKLSGAAGGHWFGTRRAWLLALYFGLINGGYTSMVAWLPAYHLEHGGTAQGGGDLVGLMTVFQVIGALGVVLFDQPQSNLQLQLKLKRLYLNQSA